MAPALRMTRSIKEKLPIFFLPFFIYVTFLCLPIPFCLLFDIPVCYDYDPGEVAQPHPDLLISMAGRAEISCTVDSPRACNPLDVPMPCVSLDLKDNDNTFDINRELSVLRLITTPLIHLAPIP